ncbi:MAG: amidohydrolase family protein [Simkania sp.]|nr:amidohydrolase family protein [Simkania sp.]
MDLILKNCEIIDATQPKPYSGSIYIAQGKIREISKTLSFKPNVEEIDLDGRTVIPGLIDAHVHVTAIDMNLADSQYPASEIAIQAGLYLEAMLLRGFTTVRDAGGADWGIADAVNKGLIKGSRLFFSGKALSPTGGHGDFRTKTASFEPCGCCCPGSYLSRLADGVTGVRAAVRDELRKGATQIKIMASGGVASPTDKITDLQYSAEEILAVVEEATDHGSYVMAHAYSPKAIQRCIHCGVRTIEHGNLIDENTAQLMALSNAYLVPTLVIYKALSEIGQKLGFPKESLQKLEAVREQGLEAIKIARSAGVKIGFGTDLLGTEAHKMQLHEFSIRSAIETSKETLTSATLVNAEILQMQGRLGIIAKDAIADLLVLKGNPFEDISLLHEDNYDLILKEGIIYQNRIARKK